MLSFITPANVYADADHNADVIGQAKTEAEAVAVYAEYFRSTGSEPVKGARKITMGSVDGWAPVF